MQNKSLENGLHQSAEILRLISEDVLVPKLTEAIDNDYPTNISIVNVRDGNTDLIYDCLHCGPTL